MILSGLKSIGPMVGLGLVAGVLGGMFGIGGGLILVPALILIFGLDLGTATGTSLMSQLLPVGLLGVLAYWKRGEVRVGLGLGIAIGVFFGAYLGAMWAGALSPRMMKRVYGVFLVAVGIYFLWSPAIARKPARTDAEIAGPNR